MLKAGRVGWMVAVLVLVGLAGAGLYFGRKRVLHSEAAVVRMNSSYAAVYAEPRVRSAMPHAFFDEFQFRQSSNEIVVTMPVSPVEPVGVSAPARTQLAGIRTWYGLRREAELCNWRLWGRCTACACGRLQTETDWLAEWGGSRGRWPGRRPRFVCSMRI